MRAERLAIDLSVLTALIARELRGLRAGQSVVCAEFRVWRWYGRFEIERLDGAPVNSDGRAHNVWLRDYADKDGAALAAAEWVTGRE